MKKFVLLSMVIFFQLVPRLVHANYIDIAIDDHSGFYVDFYWGPNGKDALAGEFSIDATGFESAAYCVELDVTAGNGTALLTNPSEYSYTFSETNVIKQNGLYAAWLMDSYSTGLGYEDSSTDTDILDAALQIAIWDTLYNYESDTNSYAFYSETQYYFENQIRYNNAEYDPDGDGDTSGTYGDGAKEEAAWKIAGAYKNNLMSTVGSAMVDNTVIPFSGKYKFYVAEFDDKQNLLVAKPIPEPATILLFGLGLLGISAVGRKRS